MANITVKQFTYRSNIDQSTITIDVIADGKHIRTRLFSTTTYTVQQALSDLKSEIEMFGQLDSNNENLYILDKTTLTTPLPPSPTKLTPSSPTPPPTPANVRIPQNQIIKSKYTAGKEYIFEKTYREYTGYYYELNGKKYAGKEYNTNSPILIPMKSPNINKLLTTAATYVYGKISGIKLDSINKIPSITFVPTEKESKEGQTIRYFTSKINTNPILIKEINKEVYNQIQSNPLYKSVSIRFNIQPSVDGQSESFFNQADLDQAEKDLPGIKAFLGYL